MKLFALAALASAAAAQQAPDLVTLLGNTSELSNLTTYLGLYPEFTNMLAGLTNITILAPSNEAFTKLLNSSAGAAASIQANDTEAIQALFSYHVLNGTYYASSVTENATFIPTALVNPTYSNVTGGQRVEAITSGEDVVFYSGLLSNSTVTSANNNFTGGTIHIIDTFLTIPANVSTTALAAELTSIYGALNASDLVTTVDGLADVTVFAPSNEAFQAIGSALENITTEDLTSILTYHVISGTVGYSSDLVNGSSLTTVAESNLTITIIDGDVFVNSAKVIIPNVLVAGGVVHVIDGILNPANSTVVPDPAASTAAPVFPGASTGSVVPFASNAPAPTTTAATATEAATSSVSTGLAQPMKTGAVGVAALFGGAAAIMNM